MSGAVVFADCDLADRSSIARTSQVIDIYAEMGLSVDLVLISDDDGAKLPATLSERARNFASLPRPENGLIPAAVGKALWQSNEEDVYSICHCSSGDIGIPWEVAKCRVVECGAKGAHIGEWDIILAETELERASISGTDAEKLRLPFRPPHLRLDAGGRKIGWIGPWSQSRVDAWSAVLASLSQNGVDPADGILLSGPFATGVAIPDNLIHRVAVGSASAHLSTLGLSIAAGDVLDQDHRIAATYLMLDRPVLITQAAADVHEGRWHLPTFDDPKDIVSAVLEWIEKPTALDDKTQSTKLAYQHDLDAMTAHIKRLISAKIVG